MGTNKPQIVWISCQPSQCLQRSTRYDRRMGIAEPADPRQCRKRSLIGYRSGRIIDDGRQRSVVVTGHQ